MKTDQKVKVSKTVSVKEENVEVNYSVAVVKNGKYEVRRYSLEDHGKDFARLAEQFATKKGYQVELE